MRTIIAGSRSIEDLGIIIQAIMLSNFSITKVISGTAKGVDQLGEMWANLNNIQCERFQANWNLYGKSAGYKRNEEMTDHADQVIVIWDGISKGSKSMLDIAIRKKMPYFLYITKIRN
jgi:hypothetical protein